MRRRILATIVAVVVAALVALFIPTADAVRRGVERGDLLQLQRDASIVASGIPAEGPVDLDVLRARVGADIAVAVYTPDGGLLAGDGPTVPDPVLAQSLDGAVAEGYVDGDLVAAIPARIGVDGPQLVVRLEESGTSARARITEATAGLAAIALAILTVAFGAGLLLARQLSRPIEELRAWTAAPGLGPPGPPPDPSGIEELDGLRASLVEARSRLTDLLLRERSFSSQVSHQLRTPVAALRVALEAELEAPRPDHTEVLVEGLGALDRLEATIDSLLSLARHTDDLSGEVELRTVVEERAAWWRNQFDALGRSIGIRGGPLEATASRAAVEHIIDVVVDNALHHGEGDVTLEVSSAPGRASVLVSDQGRFGDDRARLRSGSGHGIGLQLARSLAELSGGRLERIDGPVTRFRLDLVPAGRREGTSSSPASPSPGQPATNRTPPA